MITSRLNVQIWKQMIFVTTGSRPGLHPEFGLLERFGVCFVLLRSCLLLALAMGLLDIQVAAAQTLDNGSRLSQITFFFLNLDGTLSRGIGVIATMEPEQDPLITILENEVTRRDLGLDVEKWNAIQQDLAAAKSLPKK